MGSVNTEVRRNSGPEFDFAGFDRGVCPSLEEQSLSSAEKRAKNEGRRAPPRLLESSWRLRILDWPTLRRTSALVTESR